jgi:hypothetical protein
MDPINSINKFKEKGIPIVVLVVALFFALKIYNAQNAQLSQLTEQKDVEEKKNSALSAISGYEADFKTIKNFVNDKDIGMSLDSLGSLAQKAGVSITGVKPQPVKEYPLYNLYSFSLSLVSSSFHDLGKFFDLLEENKNIYSIDSVNIDSDQSVKAGEPLAIRAEMRVSTFIIKN